MQAKFKWEVIGDLMVSCATAGVMPEELWASWVRDLKAKPIKKYLGSVVGSLQLTSVQRKLAADAVTKGRISVAVVTDERLVRGMATAVSWLGVDIRSFSWDEVLQAAEHLGASGLVAGRVVTEVMRLRKECSKNLTE